MKLKLESRDGLTYEVTGLQKLVGLAAMLLFRSIFFPFICLLIPFAAGNECRRMNELGVGLCEPFSVRAQMSGYYREAWGWLIHGQWGK